MSASAAASQPRRLFDAEGRHRLRLRSAAFVIVVLFAALAVEGYSFYTLPLSARVRHESYDSLRSSGEVGLKLGIMGGVVFSVIYLYSIRKRWPWLRRIGNTKHWLDFHILLGLAIPILITFHSALRFHGLAGMAFWIMWAVVISGVAGKYLYSKVPRLVTAAEIDLKDLETERSRLARQLSGQDLFSEIELADLGTLPTKGQVEKMSLARAFGSMVGLDALRLWRVAALRRRHMSGIGKMISLGGVLPFGNHALEQIVSLIRRQVRLTTKICFLGKTHELFHLWHVVHRPFSYSLAILAAVHVVFVVLLGHFRW